MELGSLLQDIGPYTASYLSIFLISLVPLIFLQFIPLSKSASQPSSHTPKHAHNHDHSHGNSAIHAGVLQILISFAAGGLLGDVFFHLLPHAYSAHSHDHHNEKNHHHETHEHPSLKIGGGIIFGLMTFFIIEKLFSLSGLWLERKENFHDKGTSPTLVDSKPITEGNSNLRQRKKEKGNSTISNASKDISSSTSTKISRYLNLIADTMHNFTDGLAVTSSFLVSTKVGITTSIAVFFHEIPHEIGDYAILVHSGCTKRQAIGCQLLTALGAFGGVTLAVFADYMSRNGKEHSHHSHDSAADWILPFTAGGFLYIAMCKVFPELVKGFKTQQETLEESQLKSQENFKPKELDAWYREKVVQFVYEILAFAFGVSLMIFLTLLE